MQIDVWSDFACPWCALGLARPRGRAAATSSTATRSPWCTASFELNPHAPARVEGIHGGGGWRRKYGMTPEQVRAGHARLTALGAEVGFIFDFDRVQLGQHVRRPPAGPGGAGRPRTRTRVVQGLFAAHFSEGRQLSDPDVLRDVARRRGLPDGTSPRGAGGRHDGGEVRADEAAGPGARRDRCALLPHRWRLADPRGTGRRDAGDRAAAGLVTPRPLSRGSRRPSPRSCWGGGRRSGPPSRPPRSSGVTKPIWSWSRRADQAVVVGFGPARAPEQHDGEPGLAHQLDVGRRRSIRSAAGWAMASPASTASR